MPLQKKEISLPLRSLVVKSGLSFITVAIGLYCGYQDSFSAFYVATIVQSVNNLYDSYHFLDGYNIFVTVFHLVSFIGAIVASAFAVIHFVGGDVDSVAHLVFVTVALSVPTVHYLIEVLIKLCTGNY